MDFPRAAKGRGKRGVGGGLPVGIWYALEGKWGVIVYWAGLPQAVATFDGHFAIGSSQACVVCFATPQASKLLIAVALCRVRSLRQGVKSVEELC